MTQKSTDTFSLYGAAVVSNEVGESSPPTKRRPGWLKGWKSISWGVGKKPTTGTSVISFDSKNAQTPATSTAVPGTVDAVSDIKAETEISLNKPEQSDAKTPDMKTVNEEALRSTEAESVTQKNLQTSRRREAEEQFRCVSE